MFDTKKLTDEQVATIKGWAEEGDQLADIQKRMEDELTIRLTYMDTRFLILDLAIELKSMEEDVVDDVVDEEDGSADEKSDLDELTEDDLEILPPPGQGGAVRVSVDEIARPGSMVNGRVTFSDGEGGAWYVDEMGRLGIDPDTAGYRPSEPDVMAFQTELKSVMDRH